jgi:phosphotransferase system HPr (HPr) family protein
MTETTPTCRREVTVVNPLGLHARPAAQFVKRARSFRSEIFLIKGEQRFDALSLIDVLRANLDQGAVILLEAIGRDAEQAIESLAQLLRELKD